MLEFSTETHPVTLIKLVVEGEIEVKLIETVEEVMTSSVAETSAEIPICEFCMERVVFTENLVMI